ncbi:MAG: ATPase, T2SS/T4P/T4SS family [Chloroflexota bacterium]
MENPVKTEGKDQSDESAPVVEEQLPETSQDTRKPKLGEVLIKQGVITPEDLALALSQQLDLPYVNLTTLQIQPEALKLIPESLARKYNILPLDIIGNSILVAMSDVNDVPTLEALSAHTKMRIKTVIVVPEEIKKAIDRNYKSYGEIEKQFPETAPQDTQTRTRVNDESIAEAPAVRALDLILEDAIKNRASDIHIEPEERSLRLRYRIDGVLKEVMSLPLSAHASLISRLKVQANMNIADRRPQDGQFSLIVRDKEVDVRVATVTTAYGEMATMRILDKSFAILNLSEIGFLPENLKQYEQMLRSPFGMILISGPTGSGKTTTLYASINSLDRIGRNIITIEDPIEYHLRGINQIQVNPRAGITFAAGLRAVMRHDPNVLLVGEIRDTDTVNISIQAALTGHLLLASIHANDAVGVLFRLLDLGIEPFLISSALVGIVAQRMVRRICPRCQHTTRAPAEAALAYGKETGEEREEYIYGEGCNACSNTGYLGRIAVFEVLTLTNELRRLIISGASATEIRAQARAEGMTSMWHDAILKVKAGITTPSEVLRCVSSIA